MAKLLDRIGKLPAFGRMQDRLQSGGSMSVGGLMGSGAAVAAAWLAQRMGGPMLVVCAGVEEAEEFAEDVNLFHDGRACHFPDLEVLPGADEQPSQTILRARLSVLRHLTFGADADRSRTVSDLDYLEPGPDTRVVVAAATALMQPTCSPEDLRDGSLRINLGQAVTPHELVTWLVDEGYGSVPQVELPGQYCLRGGILDAYSHGAAEPVRVEFFGERIDSIRTFDPYTQLSTGRVERCRFSIAERTSEQGAGELKDTLLSFLPDAAPVLTAEPEFTWERARAVHDQTDNRALLVAPDVLESALRRRPHLVFVRANAGPADVDVDYRQRDVFGPDLDAALDELQRICREYTHTVVYCISPAEAERFDNLLADSGFEGRGDLRLSIGRLNHGALFPAVGVALVPHHRLFHRYHQRRFVSHTRASRPVAAAEDLDPGGFVVHVQHGIGKFVGTTVLEQDGRRREHLQIEFAEGARVYVPCDRIEMVHRYVGVGAHKPELSKLRGASWQRAKQRAQEAVEDLAAELLELQALRETQPGVAAPENKEWMRQFESEFPYEETEDQLRAIEDVKADMRQARPMDRLICGDVGYGKTEVAMRAAFLCASGGRQVAMLVPTTVLCQQHYRTFRERMADYPIRIESLSRFRTAAEAREILEATAAGKVDVVIGTHRLLQDDVSFRDLGLVIIDEEQRFGVAHKERFKKMRATVDVLTLTATPIPRTLHMALMGLREISALQTPPRDRQAIQTKVMKHNPDVLRHAVLRELNREGQVFVIHNRVRIIKDFAAQVQNIVPEANVVIAHGQMPERELAGAMDAFIEGDADVLVSTTIIENGVDIPNANTIIIHRAELLGLAEMHQLRGRVGRYIHKAYAYFFTPRSRPVTPEAEKRLEVIERFSQLGAGFDIALRDLEIRGAGNILGPSQSGHIAAVGYNLYCRLLARAAASLQGEKREEPPMVSVSIGLDALIPEDYVQVPRQRMELYRDINRAVHVSDVAQVRRAMEDRFGAPPREADNLLLEAELRILADQEGVDSIRLEDGRVHLGLRDLEAAECFFASAEVAPRAVSAGLAVIDGDYPRRNARDLAEWLKRLFRSRGHAASPLR